MPSSAPAGSFVLTTIAGVTQFTKTTNAVSLNNQAYIASLGELSAYDFNYDAPVEDHVYNIDRDSILGKDTVYDLQGLSFLRSQLKKGLYIVNGKKMLVK